MLTDAGFAGATFHGWTGYRTSSSTQGGLVTARKPTGEPSNGKQGDTMVRFASLAFGVSSYLVFLGTFVYSVGFVGNLFGPKTIDSGPTVSPVVAVAVDVLLLGLFAAQHSVMARPGFKRRWTRPAPPQVERSTYVLASSLLLALLFWQWRPLPGVVWDARWPAARTALWGLFWAGWLVVLASTFLIDHFDLFGLRQVSLYAAGRPYTPPPFRTPALHRHVRHPIMLGFLIAFWATPTMTRGHLLFAAATTAYIVIGVRLEERDLVSAHGHVYEAYRRRVPMFIPRIGSGGGRAPRNPPGETQTPGG